MKMNKHSEFIDKRINDVKKSNKWNSSIINTTHNDFVRDFASCLFTNLIRDVFTRAYLKRFTCEDCGGKSEQRCHGKNEDRPLLIRRALHKVYPDISKPVKLKNIVIAFLEEHKTTNFTFKCKVCHDIETLSERKLKQRID
jgi:hypothetical protein